MATKKSMGWIILGAITVLGVCSFGSFQLLFKRCLFWTCAPDRNFSVLDLGIPSGFFPEGSQVGQMDYPSELDGAVENGHMDVFWQQGKGAAHYTIWRFGTERQAITFFKRVARMEQEFGLTPCSDFTNLSLTTSEHLLTCGWHKFGGYRADLNARYDEYVVAFNATIDDEMSLEQFEQVVVFIDNQMKQNLSSK
jgi:hypothetical protein